MRVLILGMAVGLVAQGQVLTKSAIVRYFDPVRANIEAAAEQMPAEKYGFKLTADQMSFAEWLLHSVDRNYQDCAALKGEAVPVNLKETASLQGKPAISKAVKDSFAYCAAALDGVDDRKVVSTPELSYSFLHTVVHNNEIYGNLVGYLRVSGVMPPSTARRQGAAGKK